MGEVGEVDDAQAGPADGERPVADVGGVVEGAVGRELPRVDAAGHERVVAERVGGGADVDRAHEPGAGGSRGRCRRR